MREATAIVTAAIWHTELRSRSIPGGGLSEELEKALVSAVGDQPRWMVSYQEVHNSRTSKPCRLCTGRAALPRHQSRTSGVDASTCSGGHCW